MGRHQAHDLLWFALGMHHAKVAHAVTIRQRRQDVGNLANVLAEGQKLDRSHRQDLFSTDIIVRGGLEGQVTHMATEASITAGEDDVRRADRRSKLVERITGAPCGPAIIADTLAPSLATTILETQAEFPAIYLTGGERPPPPSTRTPCCCPWAPENRPSQLQLLQNLCSNNGNPCLPFREQGSSVSVLA